MMTDARLAMLAAEQDDTGRSCLIANLVREVARKNICQLLEEIPANDDAAWLAELRAGLLRKWATEDPRAAADWAAALPDGHDRDELLSHVAIVWSNLELSAAADWAGKLADGPAKIQVVQAVAGEAVRKQPLTALELVVDQPQSPERDALLGRAATEWTLSDAAGAVKWAAAIEDPELREQVLSSVAMAWSEKDPVAAATLISTGFQETRRQADTVVAIAQRWAQQDPVKTAAWVEQFADGEVKAAAIENVGRIWAIRNAEESGKWMTSMAQLPSK